MNYRPLYALVGLMLGLAPAATVWAKPLTDLVSPEKRRSIVEQFQRHTRPSEPVPLPADLAQPFNPAGFDQPDPEELRAAAAAAATASARVAAGQPAPAGQPALAGDREILEAIAAKILPSGMIKIGGRPPLLTFGRRNVEVGSTFTVTNPANGQDYEVALVAIEPPTFTLRYRNEEITRPIKSGKSQ